MSNTNIRPWWAVHQCSVSLCWQPGNDSVSRLRWKRFIMWKQSWYWPSHLVMPCEHAPKSQQQSLGSFVNRPPPKPHQRESKAPAIRSTLLPILWPQIQVYILHEAVTNIRFALPKFNNSLTNPNMTCMKKMRHQHINTAACPQRRQQRRKYGTKPTKPLSQASKHLIVYANRPREELNSAHWDDVHNYYQCKYNINLRTIYSGTVPKYRSELLYLSISIFRHLYISSFIG